MKTIYLFRHSIPQENSGYHNESIPISVHGEKSMKKLICKIGTEFDCVYCSPYLRAVQSAQVISSDYFVDERIRERGLGKEEELVRDFWARQYIDYDYKNIGGESLNETRQRMVDAMLYYLSRMEENQIYAVVSHATAICSYLSSVCAVAVINADTKERMIVFDGEVILEGKIKTPSCFKLVFDEDAIINITYIS